MSFSRAEIRRFNEVQTYSPPVGTYHPKVAGTIPYPKNDTEYSIRRDNWRGSTQSLWSMNSGRPSSRSSCASVASERIATRLQSAECLGVASASLQRIGPGRDGGKDGGRPGWRRGVTGRATNKTVSEANIKGSVKVKCGVKEGVARTKPKADVTRTQAKDETNGEGSCETKAKVKTSVGPETGDKVSRKPINEATSMASDEAMTEPTNKAKREDNQAATGEVDGKAIAEVNSKANCQAAGKTTAHHKGISKLIPALPRVVESEINQPALPNESTQEWQKERLPETRKFELNRLRSDWKRLTEVTGKKQISDLNSGQLKRVLQRLPTLNSGLLLDALEQISRGKEEVETLRSRVCELEREKADLQQAKISTERDLMDEISWRKEGLEKTEALVEKLRGAKCRCKAELKKCQALVDSLRMDYTKKTEELERTFLLLKNLRLEHSRKTEKLEKSQSLVENLQSENLKISEALEKSRSLVENLSMEIQTKAEELESSRLAMKNLEFESNVKSTALENSRLAVENLHLENLRCKEALKYFDSLLVKSSFSKFTQWSGNSSEVPFDPCEQTQSFRGNLRRSVIDEDCEMTEEPQVDSYLNDPTVILSDIPGSRDNESGIPKWTNVPQMDFKVEEDQQLTPEFSDVRKSPSRVQKSPRQAPENSSKDRESCSETQSCQLGGSVSLGDVEPRIESRQNLTGLKSESILSDDLTVFCSRMQFLNLDDNETGLKTEEREFKGQKDIQENLAYRESENLKKCEENLDLMDLKSLGELDRSFIYREPEGLKEIQRSSDNFPKSLIPEIDQVKLEEENNHSSFTHNQQTNHIATLELATAEGAVDLDGNHVISLSTGNARHGKDASDGKPVRNCKEKMDCKSGSALLQTYEGYDRRSRAVDKKKSELKGSLNEDDGLYRLKNVYEEQLEKFRERCYPKKVEPRRMLHEKFLDKFLHQSQEKHEEKGGSKLGEKFVKNGESFGENRGENCGEKFEESAGENPEDKFEVKCGTKLSADFNTDDYDSAWQWRKRYEELWTVAQPFKDLLSAFDSQRQLLQGHRNAGKAEIEKLSHDFAKVLNHEHERQMIGQILRLREQNATLKKELELFCVKKATTKVTRR